MTALIPSFLRKPAQVGPEVFLRELQEKARSLPNPAGSGWKDAPPAKAGVVTIRVSGLPDDNGQAEWNEHDVEYSRGRNLAGYLRELGLDEKHVLHVVIDGAIFKRQDILRVLVPEKRIARMWREVLRREAPAIELGVFEAYIPRVGTVISVVPTVDGKNAGIILGIVGAVIGGYAGWELGYGAFAAGTIASAAQGAFLGYAIGSTIGALVTPTPNRIKSGDGPNSYQWGGITNDDRAGVPEEILLGQRLVAGGRISGFRRRSGYVPPLRDNGLAIIRVNSPGTGYASPPTVAIDPPDQPGGVQATATATVSGGAVTGVTLTNRGTGYSVVPSVGFSGGGGTGASATAALVRDPKTPSRPSQDDPNFDNQAPQNNSESLYLLLRIAGHQTEGPVGITNSNLPADVVTNLPDVRINGQHYSNFPKVNVQWRTGTPGQAVIQGFDIVANSFDVNVDVTALGANIPYNYTTVSTQVDAFEVLITLPGLSHTTNSGVAQNTTRYKLEYKLHTDANWINADAFTANARRELTGQGRALQFETRRIEGLPRGQYDIRVTWISADNTNIATDQWHIVVSAITEETQLALTYDGVSLLAVSGIATEQLNGAMPTVTVMWRGAQPQKWDGSQLLAADWGVGGGTPAGRNRGWLALWLLRNKKLGTGHELPDVGIDFNSIKAYADQCDALEIVESVVGTCAAGSTITTVNLGTSVTVLAGATNGYGLRVTHTNGTIERATITDGPGTYSTVHLATPFTTPPANNEAFGFGLQEPRFQCDAYINQQQAAIDVITQLLGSARACAFFSGNLVKVGYNGPASSSQLFGMGNVVKGSLRLQYQSKRHEINAYDVTFDDEAADFETETVTVCIKSDGTFTDEAGLQAAGEVVRRRSLQLIGTRRRTEAVREGRFQLKNDYAVRTVGTFGASTDSMFAEVYDVINLSHDLPQWGYSGRVMPNDDAPASIIQSMIIMDRPVPFDGVTQYGVIVRYAAGDGAGNDLIEERIVADVAAPTDGSSYFGVTVTVPFTRIPAEGDIYAYGPIATKVKPFRLLDVSRDANIQRALSIVEYNASIHDTNGAITIPVFSSLPTYGAPPAPITNATSYIESKVNDFGVSVGSIIVEWSRPTPQPQYGFFKGARVEYGYTASGPWMILQSVDGTMYRWDTPPVGVDLFFRLTPYSNAGRYNFAGAYIITTPVHLTSNWARNISPQNPSAVTLAASALPNANRNRAVRTGNNPGQGSPQQLFDLFINFTFSDVVNPAGTLVGFRGIVYLLTGGDPNVPYWDSGLVTNTNIRSIGVPGLSVNQKDTYIAAVEAIYLDGNKSALVTSTGLLLNPDTGEPLLQTSDDRNVAAYAETFDTAGVVPTGFTKAPGDTLAVTDSSLQVTIGNLASTFIQWNLKQWSDAYLDTRRGGGGGGVGRGFSVELAFDPRTAGFFIPGSSMLVSFDDGLGSVVTQTVPLITKNEAHIYKVDFGSSVMSTSTSVSPKVTVDLSGAFTSFVTWALRGIAVAFDDIAWNVDGHLDRAIRAREQFGKDPSLFGFFLQSPVRTTDDLGNVSLYDSNGQQFIRSGGVDTAVRRAFKSAISRTFNDAFLRFDLLANATFSNGGIDPIIPRPAAHNRVRMAIEMADANTVDGPSSLYPFRRYLEATEIGRDGFRFSMRTMYGGTLAVYRDVAPVGGWAHSVGRKSDLVVGGQGGWYNFGVQPSPALPTSLTSYYRNVVWIEAAMPLLKKANGSFYYVDVSIRCTMGQSNDDDPMTFTGTPRVTGPHNLRALTDGNTWRMPIVISGNSDSLVVRDILVECLGVGVETGGGSGGNPTTIRLMCVELAYQQGGAINAGTLDQNYNIILAEV